MYYFRSRSGNLEIVVNLSEIVIFVRSYSGRRLWSTVSIPR